MDHLTYNNPYERFMIMILERMEKFEDKMELVIGNLKQKDGVSYVLRIKTIGLDAIHYNKINILIKQYLNADLVFFGEQMIQVLVHNNKHLLYIDTLFKELLNNCAIKVSQIAIENELDLDTGIKLVNNNINYKLIAEKISYD